MNTSTLIPDKGRSRLGLDVPSLDLALQRFNPQGAPEDPSHVNIEWIPRPDYSAAILHAARSFRVGEVILLDPDDFGNSLAGLLSFRNSEKISLAGSKRTNAKVAFQQDVQTSQLPTELKHRMMELVALPAKWDGENAKAVRLSAIREALVFLVHLRGAFSTFIPPFVAPLFNGSVQLDWFGDHRRLEMELTESGWSLVGTRLRHEHPHEYFEAEVAFNERDLLAQFYAWFANRTEVNEWPAR